MPKRDATIVENGNDSRAAVAQERLAPATGPPKNRSPRARGELICARPVPVLLLALAFVTLPDLGVSGSPARPSAAAAFARVTAAIARPGPVHAALSVRPERAGDDARKVLGKRYQTELPGPPPEAADEAAGARLRERIERDEAAQDGGAWAGGAFSSFFVWVLLGAMVLVALIWVVASLSGYQRDEKAAPEPGPALPPDLAAVVEQPLGDAEVLARAGRYGEAIHALLLRTLAELMRRLDRPLPRSLTSREILVQVRLPEAAREALVTLITVAEVSHFGGAEPGAADYERCVACFQAFASAYRAGARAAAEAGHNGGPAPLRPGRLG